MRSVLLALVLLLVLVLTLTSALVAVAYFSVQERLFANVSDVPVAPVGLVLGASVRPNKQPSPVLQDRIDVGVLLLRAGRVQKLLLSGDNRDTHYNEVAAMHRAAMSLGATQQELVLDNAGWRTYDSCYRAREIYGLKSLVVITQRFHLSRAVYICKKLGLDAYGLAADGPTYAPPLKLQLRELGAWALALIDVRFEEPSPVLGPREPIDPASAPSEDEP
jgi:vancomycin permeability regulator SanA